MIYVVAGWISLAFVSASPGAWPQFRGPAGDGVVAEPSFPMTWSETENVAWKTPIPGAGWSQPVVVGDRVYVSFAESADGTKPKKMGEGSVDPRSMIPVAGKPPQVVYKWGFVCLNLATGEILWRRDAAEQMPSIPAHPSNTYATETPATDGKQVYLQFGSIGKFFAFDLDGNLQWEVDLGLQTMAAGFGTGSSPIVHEGKVIVQCYNADNAVLRALDPASGKEVWRAERKKGSSWSTPFLWRTKDRVELIACGDSRVYSYDPSTGETLWEVGGIPSSFSASPVGNADALVLGNNGPFSTAPLFSVKPGAKGDITLPKGAKSNEFVNWWRLRSGPGLSSPVIQGDYLYVSQDAFVNCYDVRTGERIYRERLPQGGSVIASLLIVGDRIFIQGEDGRGTFVKTGPTFEVVGTNKLDDVFWSSPAVAGESLLLRGVDKLYCIRANDNP